MNNISDFEAHKRDEEWDAREDCRKARKEKKCICDYISPGAAALHAVFHGIDGPLPKVRNSLCPIHGDGPRSPEVFTADTYRRDNQE